MKAENGKLKYRVRGRERSVKQIRRVSLTYRAVCTHHKQILFGHALAFSAFRFLPSAFPRIFHQRRFTSSYRNCGLGESERAGPIGVAGAYLDPFHSAAGIDNIVIGAAMVPAQWPWFSAPHGADQLDLGEKTNRIGSERNVPTILLAIARDPIEELRPSASLAIRAVGRG